MRERKYVKLRCDMYEDTKFKIIATMEGRDTINYIWTRILALCGKINNSFGYLLVSKNIPYTIEILSIEFNRSKDQVEHAIKVFMELNMISIDENKILRVCNWNKYQEKRKKENKKVDSIVENEMKIEIKEGINSEISNEKQRENQVKKAELEILNEVEEKNEIQDNNEEVIIKEMIKNQEVDFKDKKITKLNVVKNKDKNEVDLNIKKDDTQILEKKKKEDDKLIKIGETDKNNSDIDYTSKKVCEEKDKSKSVKKKKKKSKLENIISMEDCYDSDEVIYFQDVIEEDLGKLIKTFNYADV